MRRCIIHIGHPKTGTTYLQHCLHLNADVFGARNYWVPGDFRAFGFHDLRPLCEQGRTLSGNLAPMHRLLTEGPGDAVPAMNDYLFGAPGMPYDCDVILSSELFFYYPHCTAQVISAARQFGFQPMVVAYLQRQDRAAIASFLQNVRFHKFFDGVVDFLVHDCFIAYGHYLGVLQQTVAGFAELDLRIRTFAPQYLHNQDIWADFLATIECRVDPHQCQRPRRPSNQGLALEQYQALRAANLFGATEFAGQLAQSPVVLTSADRERTARFYYRDHVRRFIADRILPENISMVERFMKSAGSQEREHWCLLDPVQRKTEIDEPFLIELQQRMLSSLASQPV